MTVVSYEQKPYAPKVHFDNYVVTVRPGATADMVADTVRHYEYAAIVLERGLTDTGKEETKTRVTYDLPPNTTEAPVNIFGHVLLKVDDNEYVFSVNKCDHTSTAQEIVDAVWTLYAGLMLGETGGNWNTTPRNNTQQQQTTYNEGAMRRPDGSADLKATFPRSGGEQPSDPSVPDDVIAMNYYDWNQCKTAPTGAVVSFPIVGLDQRFDEKTGKPVVRPVTTYQGQPSDRVYKSLFISGQNVDYISDSYTKSTMLTVLDGTNLEGTWDVYYKVKHPSDNPEMTFLNILRIVPTVDDDLDDEPGQFESVPF